MGRDSRWDAVRRVVLARDGYKCIRCMGEAHHVHHRRVKGIGGTADESIKYGPGNCISLCFECHAHVHAHPEESYALGYLVKSGQDPLDVPVAVKVGTGRLRLTADGGAVREANYAFF